MTLLPDNIVVGRTYETYSGARYRVAVAYADKLAVYRIGEKTIIEVSRRRFAAIAEKEVPDKGSFS